MVKLELTQGQLEWLELLLGRGMDGALENNKRERRHCNNIYQKVVDILEKQGIDYPNNLYFQNAKSKKEGVA